tara:strand:+ start:38 stop:211 length:174 start_codon:yes stop_codon:yes gene_type:complete
MAGDWMNEEPIGEWTIRVWNECREELGQEWVFINWVRQNYPDVWTEFNDFDRMMSGV